MKARHLCFLIAPLLLLIGHSTAFATSRAIEVKQVHADTEAQTTICPIDIGSECHLAFKVLPTDKRTPDFITLDIESSPSSVDILFRTSDKKKVHLDHGDFLRIEMDKSGSAEENVVLFRPSPTEEQDSTLLVLRSPGEPFAELKVTIRSNNDSRRPGLANSHKNKDVNSEEPTALFERLSLHDVRVIHCEYDARGKSLTLHVADLYASYDDDPSYPGECPCSLHFQGIKTFFMDIKTREGIRITEANVIKEAQSFRLELALNLGMGDRSTGPSIILEFETLRIDNLSSRPDSIWNPKD